MSASDDRSSLRVQLGQILDALLPQQCLLCDQPTGNKHPLCEICCDRLVPNRDSCPRCALPSCGGHLCPQCQQHPPLIHQIHAPFLYDAALAMLVQRWKYQGDRELAALAALLIARRVRKPDDLGILMPIPLHWSRELRRGFNQSEDLAWYLRQIWRVDKLPPSVRFVRLRRGKSQAGSTRRQRLEKPTLRFAVRGSLAGARVTLVDDICTTGATAESAARACLEAGAAQVSLLCLARTPLR
ncbi:MAG: double zinc ribbon domain-containing protein [Pseudomonadota bacterium]